MDTSSWHFEDSRTVESLRYLAIHEAFKSCELWPSLVWYWFQLQLYFHVVASVTRRPSGFQPEWHVAQPLPMEVIAAVVNLEWLINLLPCDPVMTSPPLVALKRNGVTWLHAHSVLASFVSPHQLSVVRGIVVGFDILHVFEHFIAVRSVEYAVISTVWFRWCDILHCNRCRALWFSDMASWTWIDHGVDGSSVLAFVGTGTASDSLANIGDIWLTGLTQTQSEFHLLLSVCR